MTRSVRISARLSKIHPSAITSLLLAWLLVLLPISLSAGQPVFAPDGVTLSGYDVVAHFTDSEAVPGDPMISYHWQDVDWLFANEEHQEMFMDSPEQFVPRYGGFCALGADLNWPELSECFSAASAQP